MILVLFVIVGELAQRVLAVIVDNSVVEKSREAEADVTITYQYILTRSTLRPKN